MNIYHTIQKGATHPVFCEDYFCSLRLGSELFIGAVFDGCSSGQESHFASALGGKLLKKCVIDLHQDIHFGGRPSLENIMPEEIAKLILRNWFEQLKLLKKDLRLDKNEMLTTLLLIVYNTHLRQAFLVGFGDGYIAIDGKIHDLDQANMPDYPAYHLAESFEQWYRDQRQRFHVDRPRDLAISTDGIDTFRFQNSKISENAPDPIDLLLIDAVGSTDLTMLTDKVDLLNQKYGLRPMDDLALLRLIL